MPATLQASGQPAEPADDAVTEPTTAPALDPQPVVTPTEPVSVGAPQADQSVSWGWVVFWGLMAIALIWGIKLKLEATFYRCPRCRRWWAGDVKDQRSEYFTAMETRTHRTTHKNKHLQVTGYSEAQVREPVTRSRKTEYIECRTCGHEWVQSSVS